MMKEKHKFNNEDDSKLQDMIKMFKEEELLPPVNPHHNSKVHSRNTRTSASQKVKSCSAVTYGKNNRLETTCMVNGIIT